MSHLAAATIHPDKGDPAHQLVPLFGVLERYHYLQVIVGEVLVAPGTWENELHKQFPVQV